AQSNRLINAGAKQVIGSGSARFANQVLAVVQIRRLDTRYSFGLASSAVIVGITRRDWTADRRKERARPIQPPKWICATGSDLRLRVGIGIIRVGIDRIGLQFLPVERISCVFEVRVVLSG